jgi:hypothetical protein
MLHQLQSRLVAGGAATDPAARRGPGDWQARSGRARILLESPDGPETRARRDALVAAGFDVAGCAGPAPRAPERPADPSGSNCDLLACGGCSLVEGADVVVTAADLNESADIAAAVRDTGKAVVLVEAGSPAGDRFVASVERALAG